MEDSKRFFRIVYPILRQHLADKEVFVFRYDKALGF